MADEFHDSIRDLTNEIRKLKIDLSNLRADNKRYKEQIYGGTEHYYKEIPNAIKQAFKEAGVGVYSTKGNGHQVGDLTKTTENKIDREVKKFVDAIAEVEEKLDYMGHGDVEWYKTVEGMKLLQDIVQNVAKDMNNVGSVLGQFGQTYNNFDNALINLANSVKVIEENGSRYYERIDTFISQARDDAAKLHEAVSPLKETLDNTKTSAESVNQTLSDMATNSQMVNNILGNLNSGLTNFEANVNLVSNSIYNQAVAVSNNTNQITQGLASLQQTIGDTRADLNQMRKSIRQVTSANVSAMNRISSAQQKMNSSSGGGSTFRQQQVRNSDRAKQAGFIALLIPALAKLLRKTPITDYFKLLALRYGAGKSGRGDNALGGAIAYMAAPLITGALGTALLNKGFRTAIGNVFKGTGRLLWNLPKGIAMPNGGIMRWNQMGKTWEGLQAGWKAGASGQYKNAMTLAQHKDYLGYKHITGVKTVTMSNGQTTLVPQTKYVTGAINQSKGFDKGFRLYNNLAKTFGFGGANSTGVLGGSALGKGTLAGNATKLLGRLAGPLAFLGYTVEDFDGRFGDAYKKEGGKGWWKQMGKTTAGATAGATGAVLGGVKGGAIGAAIGTAILPGVGTAIGGAIGAALGAFFGGKTFKAVSDFIFGNMNKKQKEQAEILRENHQKMPGWFADRWAMIVEPIRGIWQAIKEWWQEHFGIDTGGDDDSSRQNKNVKTQVNQLVKDTEDYEKVKHYYDKYYSKGKSAKFHTGWWAFHQKYHNYKDAYAQNALGGTYISEKDWLEKNKGKTTKDYHNTDMYKKYLKLLDTKEAHAYADRQIKTYIANAPAQINARKEALVNASQTPLNANELISRIKMQSLTKEQLTTALKGNKNYEALKDRQGLWTIDNNSFKNDVKFLGKGTQDVFAQILQGKNIRGVKITSAMGSKTSPHDKTGGHYNPIGNTFDFTISDRSQIPAVNRMLEEAKRKGLITGYLDEYTHPSKGSTGGHFHVSATNPMAASMSKAELEKLNNAGVAVSTNTSTAEAQAADIKASSELRSDLAQFIKYKDKNGKQERARNIIMSAVDVTGSLGVWGITQINNNGMRVGK